MDFINDTFINIYSDENPILNVGDSCYFLFNNVNDVHVLLIGFGVIISDKLETGIHKTYKIKLTGLEDYPTTQKKFIFGKQFYLNPIRGNEKLFYIHDSYGVEFFEVNLFKVDCFFVRKTLDGIKELREYCCSIKMKQINEQLNDINSLLI